MATSCRGGGVSPFLETLAAEDRAIVEAVQSFTMTSPERVAALIDAVRYVERAGIEGAIVECGVWRGGSSMAALKTLQAVGTPTREIYLYDTYEGMSEPTSVDREASTGREAQAMLDASDRSDMVWAFASLDDVKVNVGSVGYPADRLHYVAGKVEETIPQTIPDKIALLRLDTDWYESTRHELQHLYPRLQSRGVLIVDDYGHWEGARRAVDEYFDSIMPPILLNRIDYTGRIAIKP